jgi:hypothetical protein
MVEAPSQIRDVIAQTREEVADTIHALGERVDATRHVAEAISGEADHVKRAAAHATAKVTGLGHHALGSATSQLKATSSKQRAAFPILLALGLALAAIGLLITRRRQALSEDDLDWESIDT